MLCYLTAVLKIIGFLLLLIVVDTKKPVILWCDSFPFFNWRLKEANLFSDKYQMLNLADENKWNVIDKIKVRFVFTKFQCHLVLSVLQIIFQFSFLVAVLGGEINEDSHIFLTDRG